MKVEIENLNGIREIYDGVMKTFFLQFKKKETQTYDRKLTIELSDGSKESFLLSETFYIAIDDVVYQDSGWLESCLLLLKGKKMTLLELMKFYHEYTGKKLYSEHIIIGDNELFDEEYSFYENEEYKEEEYPYIKYDCHSKTVHFF